MANTASELARLTVGACTHVSQWMDTSLVACEACIIKAVTTAQDEARREEREACAQIAEAEPFKNFQIKEAIAAAIRRRT